MDYQRPQTIWGDDVDREASQDSFVNSARNADSTEVVDVRVVSEEPSDPKFVRPGTHGSKADQQMTNNSTNNSARPQRARPQKAPVKAVDAGQVERVTNVPTGPGPSILDPHGETPWIQYKKVMELESPDRCTLVFKKKDKSHVKFFMIRELIGVNIEEELRHLRDLQQHPAFMELLKVFKGSSQTLILLPHIKVTLYEVMQIPPQVDNNEVLQTKQIACILRQVRLL